MVELISSWLMNDYEIKRKDSIHGDNVKITIFLKDIVCCNYYYYHQHTDECWFEGSLFYYWKI